MNLMVIWLESWTSSCHH